MPIPFDPRVHHRRSIRLPGYDYEQPGDYYITLCETNHRCIFGWIADGALKPSPIGQSVLTTWREFATRHAYMRIDEWPLMPNHLHAIVVLTNEGWDQWQGYQECMRNGLADARTPKPAIVRKTLGSLVGAFKTESTNDVNAVTGVAGAKVWQRDFFEHIVRSKDELQEIREYIRQNPERWEEDRENGKWERGE